MEQRPSLFAGTSVGAINAAYSFNDHVAGHNRPSQQHRSSTPRAPAAMRLPPEHVGSVFGPVSAPRKLRFARTTRMSSTCTLFHRPVRVIIMGFLDMQNGRAS
ncbi:hypothetical protein [Saccharopolyspora sp. NPDC002376]